jgi:hypothetical protein
MNVVEVKTQVQLDKLKPGGIAAVRSGNFRASGSAQVTAYDSAQVRASGSAQVRASGSAQVTASGSAQVRAYDSAQVTASGSARRSPDRNPGNHYGAGVVRLLRRRSEARHRHPLQGARR